MIAAELKPGQWFRFVDDPRPKLCTYVDQYLFLCTDGCELVSPSRNEIVEILPDCTGYDWMPPAKPKRYRPFANAEEFEPYRERWYRNKGTCYPKRRGSAIGYDSVNGVSLQEHFERSEFEDGMPFGIEVSDE